MTTTTILVGAGKSGRLFHRALSERSDIQVIAIASSDGTSAAALGGPGTAVLASGADWHHLTPDLVVIATPHSLHRHIIETALATHATVLCDKPVVTSRTDWRAVSLLADASGQRIFCSLVQRCFASMTQCRSYVRRHIAELERIEVTQRLRRSDAYYRSWKGLPSMAAGGVVMNQGIHALDLACYLTGLEPALVSGVGKSRPGVGVETYAELKLTIGPVPCEAVFTTDAPVELPQELRFHFGNRVVCVVGSEFPRWETAAASEADAVCARLRGLPDPYGPGYDGAVGDVLAAMASEGPGAYELGLAGVSDVHQLIYDYYEACGRGDGSE